MTYSDAQVAVSCVWDEVMDLVPYGLLCDVGAGGDEVYVRIWLRGAEDGRQEMRLTVAEVGDYPDECARRIAMFVRYCRKALLGEEMSNDRFRRLPEVVALEEIGAKHIRERDNMEWGAEMWGGAVCLWVHRFRDDGGVDENCLRLTPRIVLEKPEMADRAVREFARRLVEEE